MRGTIILKIIKSLQEHKKLISLVWIIFLLISSCKKVKMDTELESEKNEHLSGGECSTFDIGPNAFTHPIDQLSGTDELFFFVGNSFFNQNWVSSPAYTTARDGLGPVFNARSCSSCHFKDGRGKPPNYFGESSQGYLIRLSIPGENEHGDVIAEPTYGKQLQDRSINGTLYEGKIDLTYEMIQGKYADGTSYELQKPLHKFYDLKYGEMSSEVQTSPRIANQIIGLGLLEAISEDQILANEDIFDLNNDGISGKANRVWNILEEETQIGRFGWKGTHPTVLQQTASAFIGDIGITNKLFPEQNCTDIQINCHEAFDSEIHEITFDDLIKTAKYCATTAVPVRRNVDNQNILKGKRIFNNIGCNNCHIEKYMTENHPSIPELSNQIIRPYTDLLLHDMGNKLADGRPEFLANGNEWKTSPLWGIGLFEVVNNHTYYLHDGRARNLEEAILWHGGESNNVIKSYKHLKADEREQLLEFLKSL